MNKYNLVLLCYLLLFSALTPVLAQVNISGEITHNNEPLDQVTIRVYERGQFVRTVAANKKGKYQVVLPYSHVYEFVFERYLMMDVHVVIDTRVKGSVSANTKGFEVPFNMSMHHHFDELDDQVSQKSIGTIRHAGSGKESFEFFPDQTVIKQVKALNESSKNLDAQGKKPTKQEDFEAHNEPIVADDDTRESETDSFQNESEKAESSETDVAIKRMEEKDDALAKATELSADRKREQLAQKQEKESEREKETSSNLVDSKMARSERLQENNDRQYQANQNLAISDSINNQLIIASLNAPRKVNESANSPQLIEHLKRESSLTCTEEILRISKLGKKSNYVHEHCEYGLFDTDSFYRDDEEISEEEFYRIKKLVNE